MADEKTRSGGGAAQGVAKAGANRTDRTDRADRTGRADQADQADQASDCPCRHKNTPRSMELQADMQKRLNRAIGQLTGVKAMIEDNRYCGARVGDGAGRAYAYLRGGRGACRQRRGDR